MLATFPDITRRKTRRLHLRPPSDGDLAFLTDLFSRHEMVAHRPHPAPDSPAQSAERLARDLAHWRRHGFGRWALEMGDHLIGFGGLTAMDGIEGLTISYHLHPDVWRRGFATELVEEALSVAFDVIAAPRVVGLVRPVNPASRAVLERTGFSFEGEVELDGAPTLLLARYPSCIA
jgi:RimJ/RimL family protein N-acetyltransferase